MNSKDKFVDNVPNNEEKVNRDEGTANFRVQPARGEREKESG